ncbi:glycosyltransferase family 92 protein [Methylococcus sp. EFPC2]|uniref:glycosyltransferase family 92 protein n=1 Tax=Methylococcus sp. EFPC2 TaxID=2812648 RepID=UPI00196883CE|nr:glycosyltransferase family 92 protein [Methylococcus sp. EFPC2]QSA95910.1 glycosyltransferase family 92 protein [Methylococcus sp. EFPC2]
MNTGLVKHIKDIGKKIGLDVIVNMVQKKAPIWFFYTKNLFQSSYGDRREIRLNGRPAIYDIFSCRDNQYIGIVGRYDSVSDPALLRCIFPSGQVSSGILIDDEAHEIEGQQVLLLLFPVPEEEKNKAQTSINLKIESLTLVSDFRVFLGQPGRKELLSVSTLMKDEDRFLPEWIAYYKLLGATHFYIYDNRSIKRGKIRRLLRPFIEEGSVTLIDWDYPYESGAIDNSWRFCQRGQMHHCLYKYGDRTNWMLFIDVDEFIFPVAGGESLKPILDQYGDDPSVAGLQFKMIWFGNSGFQTVPAGLVIENYTRRAPRVLEAGREKCAVKPGLTELLFIHDVKSSLPGTRVVSVSPEEYRINHYFATSSKRQRRGNTDHNEVADLGMERFCRPIKKSLALE